MTELLQNQMSFIGRQKLEAAPIFVTGIPRSGSTFLQHLLSQHPRITIYGQEPAGIIWGQWLQELVQACDQVRDSNESINYEAPHYAGEIDPEKVAAGYLKFIKEYFCSGENPSRWGLKSLTECRVAADTIRTLWPETRWIITLRDPFRSIESLRNTYDTEHYFPVESICQWWTEAAQFAQTEPNARLILFDRLTSAELRHQCVAELFDFLGEQLTEEVIRYTEEWPVIHKVIEDNERKYVLSQEEREKLMEASLDFAAAVSELEYHT